MPIYEFRCDACGERFEALVDAGTEAFECRHCGAPDAGRVLSALAPPMRLVKSQGAARKQESANAKLRRATKERFKAARRRQREAGGKDRKA